MRDLDRIDRILDKICTVWKASPDLRLIQLLSNIQYNVGVDMYYVEDDVLEQRLNAQLKEEA